MQKIVIRWLLYVEPLFICWFCHRLNQLCRSKCWEKWLILPFPGIRDGFPGVFSEGCVPSSLSIRLVWVRFVNRSTCFCCNCWQNECLTCSLPPFSSARSNSSDERKESWRWDVTRDKSFEIQLLYISVLLIRCAFTDVKIWKPILWLWVNTLDIYASDNRVPICRAAHKHRLWSGTSFPDKFPTQEKPWPKMVQSQSWLSVLLPLL